MSKYRNFNLEGDTYNRIGTRQADLPQLSDALNREDWDSSNVYGSRGNKNRVRNVEGRRVIEFCENNAYEF
jgi:hypothetical protein